VVHDSADSELIDQLAASEAEAATAEPMGSLRLDYSIIRLNT